MKQVDRNEVIDEIIAQVILDDEDDPFEKYIIWAVRESSTLDELEKEFEFSIKTLYDIIQALKVKYPYESFNQLTGEID